MAGSAERYAWAMAKRSAWTKKRNIPGDEQLTSAYEGFLILRWLHRPTATALVVGALAGGWAGWKLGVGQGVVVGIICSTIGAALGAAAGVLLCWLVRMLGWFAWW